MTNDNETDGMLTMPQQCMWYHSSTDVNTGEMINPIPCGDCDGYAPAKLSEHFSVERGRMVWRYEPLCENYSEVLKAPPPLPSTTKTTVQRPNKGQDLEGRV